MCDNPMCAPAAIERHYRDTEAMPFDDFFVTCSKCGRERAPGEMDNELDDVCTDCVCDIMRIVRRTAQDLLFQSDYELFERILRTYSDGVL